MTTPTPQLFTNSLDVGDVGAPGSVVFSDGTYLISGSGGNMWFTKDAFQFVWTRLEGDFTVSSDVDFPTIGSDPHRKAGLVIRQSLETDSAYASMALHGDGLTSLQYRDATGGRTREIQTASLAPGRIGIVRRGNRITGTVNGAPSGGSVRLTFGGDVFVGLGVCSHLRGVLETAAFSNVEIGPAVEGGGLHSTLETVDVASTDRRVVHVFDEHIEAPNWTVDDRLIYNSGGGLWAIPVAGGKSTAVDTGFAVHCNNDHGLSPDGSSIAISDQSTEDGDSRIYVVPIEGGAPRLVTQQAPSYWHGWSPDGSTLAFCGRRDGKWGIFTIPAEGGDECRLTTADGLDDGPEYSPDGRWIFFNSDRSGRMQIYRMLTDGTSVERVLADGRADWFPHLSPDGRWLVMLSYAPDVEGHPPDLDVQLRLLDLESGEVSLLASLFGGQGTINVPSWSADSTRLAFVSYQYL